MADTPSSFCESNLESCSPVSVVSHSNSVLSSISERIRKPIKRKRQTKKQKKLNKIIKLFLNSDMAIPVESEYTKRVRREMRETYPVRLAEIYNKFNSINDDLIMDQFAKKDKILELLTELEDQFYTALFEDLGAHHAKELGYIICSRYGIKHDPKNPFIHL
jgi:hypothetical protein